jgi:hypothetical protein
MSIHTQLEELKESFKCDIKDIVDGSFKLDEAKVDDGDGKVESKEELLSLAMTMAKKAFGDKVDSEKVKGVVDNAIKDSNGDWKKASGIVVGSFNESVNESSNEIIYGVEDMLFTKLTDWEGKSIVHEGKRYNIVDIHDKIDESVFDLDDGEGKIKKLSISHKQLSFDDLSEATRAGDTLTTKDKNGKSLKVGDAVVCHGKKYSIAGEHKKGNTVTIELDDGKGKNKKISKEMFEKDAMKSSFVEGYNKSKYKTESKYDSDDDMYEQCDCDDDPCTCEKVDEESSSKVKKWEEVRDRLLYKIDMNVGNKKLIRKLQKDVDDYNDLINKENSKKK